MRTLIYPKVNPLGDSIIMILYAHMLSELTGERINVISNLFRQEKFSSIIPFGNVVYNDKDITIEYKFDKYEPVFWNFLKISENFTNTLTKHVFNQQKREPYFTYQFDAKQSYRCIKNKEKVIKNYKVGEIVEGTIKAVQSYGCFVSIESLDCLLHSSEVSHLKISNLN